MAAGSFIFENKVRPGCYIQIKGVPKASANMSERGTVVILMNADSGGLLTEISANDILTGGSSAKGFPLGMFTDTTSILNYVYPYVNKIIVGRLNYGGTKASARLLSASDDTATLTATANFDGTFGNRLSVLIVAEQTGQGKYKGEGFFVRTSLDGEVVNEQNVKDPIDLKNNDYVSFTKADSLSALSAVSAVDLSGGENGSESDENLTKILSKLTGMSWNTLGFCGQETNKPVIDTYIRNLRENKGKYRQAVMCDSITSDYEGIISTLQAFVIEGDDLEYLENIQSDPGEEAKRQAAFRLREMFAVAFVAAITAGSDVNVSNTYAPVPANVIEVIPAVDDENAEVLLFSGAFMFTHNSQNNIVIEKDINTLHTYTQTRTAPFSKNRVIRCLDELSNTKVKIWEEMFIGKINNNVTGRNLLKSQIMSIIQNLVKVGALNESDTQIVVEQGDDVDKVRSYETVRPIDAMEQLYSYVTVLG